MSCEGVGIRAVGIVIVGTAYCMRVLTVGNGAIQVLGWPINPFALLIVAVILMALPETVEMLPFGPLND